MVEAAKVHLAHFFEILDRHMEREGFTYSELRDHQEKAIRMALDIIKAQGMCYIAPTGEGKTLGGFAAIYSALMEGKVGVYLVPYTQVLDQKEVQLREFCEGVAHVIKLSGEQRPPVAEIRAHQDQLVIVATFEAFQAFLFQMQNRRYFDRRDCFGTVVVDEVHILGERGRGANLELLLYKLREDYPALRFCLMTATFTDEDATKWSALLNCQKHYNDPSRKFSFQEIVLKETRMHPSKDQREVARAEKICKIEMCCWEFLDNHLPQIEFDIQEKEVEGRLKCVIDWEEIEENLHVLTGRLLIFCRTRHFAELMAKIINKAFTRFLKKYFEKDEQIKEIFSCEHIHAGIPREKQHQIAEQFSVGEGIRILCASPLLEAGIDIPKIKQVIILDAEKYSATQLAQMCGRTRENDGKIIMFIADEPPPIRFALDKQRNKEICFEVLKHCEEFLTHRMYYTDGAMRQRVRPGKLLILCDSWELTMNLQEKLDMFCAELVDKKRLEGTFHTQSLDTGMDRALQRQILSQFNEGGGIQILCWAPGWEESYTIPEILGVVIVRADKFSGVMDALHQKWNTEYNTIFIDTERIASMHTKPVWEVINEALFAQHKKEFRSYIQQQLVLLEVLIPAKEVEDVLQHYESLLVQRGYYDPRDYGDALQEYRSVKNLYQQFASKPEEMAESSSMPKARIEFLPCRNPGVDYYSREWFYKTKLRLNKEFAEFMDGDSEGLQIVGFQLTSLPPRITTRDMPRIILSNLFRHQYLKRKLEHRLRFYQALGIKYDLGATLTDLRSQEFIRGTKKDGRYALSYLGYAVVETGIDHRLAHAALRLFREQEYFDEVITDDPDAKVNRKFFYKLMEFIANAILTLGPSTARKDENIREFLVRYDAKALAETKTLRETYNISEGDEETYRRAAVWLASSLYCLYYGYKLHEQAKQAAPEQYFQVPWVGFEPEAQKVQERFHRIISKFQREGEELPRKPKPFPHPVFTPESHYLEYIRKILQDQKKAGATIMEIQRHLKILFRKKRAKGEEKIRQTPNIEKNDLRQKIRDLRNEYPVKVPESTIHSCLEQLIVKGEAHKETDPPIRAHRPPDRYWHIHYKPTAAIKYRCKECMHFVLDPTQRDAETGIKTNCKIRHMACIQLQPACPEFQLKAKSRITFSDFECVPLRDNQTTTIQKLFIMKRCPWCRELESVLVPSYNRLTICKHCGTLFWRTRRKQYVGQHHVEIPTKRKKYVAGYPYIGVYPSKQAIFLDKNRAIAIFHQEHTKFPLIRVYYWKKHMKSYFLEEVREVIVAGGTLSPADRLFLEENQIDITDFTDAEIQEVELGKERADALREALKSLTGKSLLRKAQDLTIAKMLSNIAYTLQCTPPLSSERIHDLVMRQFDHITLSCFVFRSQSGLDVIDYINKLRSHEGNAEKAIWEAVKESLPLEWQIKGRQASRYARTVLYWGSKAFDPFNAALNYLYYLLQVKVGEQLSKAGFCRYHPGPGILHRRQGPKSKSGKKGILGKLREKVAKKVRRIRTQKNREFLFDFMDAYRPPFRHYLLLAIRRGEFDIETDFGNGLDEWRRRVYYPNKEGREKLKQLFQYVCNRSFLHKTEKVPLTIIMQQEAETFAQFLQGKTDTHMPFKAYEDEAAMQEVEAFYQKIQQIADYEPPATSIRAKAAVPTESDQLATQDELPTNVIIVVDNDRDGFLSALLLMIKYYEQLPNVTVIVAENNPDHRLSISNVLEERIPQLLVEHARNVIIVADFALKEGFGFYSNIIQSYREFLGGDEERIQFSWYDHHENDLALLDQLRSHSGFQLSHDLTRSAYKIIQQEFQETLDPARLSSHHPWNFYQSFPKYLEEFFAINEELSYLGKWYRWFKYYWHSPPRNFKKWSNFFIKILRVRKVKPPPKFPWEKKTIKELLVHKSFHHETAGVQTFNLLGFRYPFPIDEVKHLLQERLKVQIPDFVWCIWYDYTCSLRVFNKKDVDLRGIQRAQGVSAHRYTGPIYTPKRLVYNLQTAKIYQYLLPEEFYEHLKKSRLTENQADLWQADSLLLKESEDIYLTWKNKIKYIKAAENAQERRNLEDKLLAEITTRFTDEGRIGYRSFHFPCKKTQKTLNIPFADVVLCFCHWKHRQRLSTFLHYLLHTYISENPYSSNILYIDTVRETLRFKHLLEFNTPLPAIKNFLFAKIGEFDAFMKFLEKDFRGLLSQHKIEIVLIDSPFKLIEEHLRLLYQNTTVFYLKRSPIMAQFVERLKHIAEDSEVSILLTRTQTRGDEWRPYLPEAVREDLNYYLHLKKQTRKKYHLTWQETVHTPKRIKLYRPVKVRREDIFQIDFSKTFRTSPQVKPESQVEPEPTDIFPIIELPNGLKVVIYQPSQYTKLPNLVKSIVEMDDRQRDMDLILWTNGDYSIYLKKDEDGYTDFDLSKLKKLYGGKHTSKGMIFRMEDSVRPFIEFLEVFKELFLDLHHLLIFLSRLREALKEREVASGSNLPLTPKLPYAGARIQQFYEDIAPIFTSPSPTPQKIKEIWVNFIQSLRSFFHWGAIYNMTESFLGDLSLLDRHNPDSEEIKELILSGLQQGFK